MKQDLIVVFGSQPDTKTWKLPDQIYDCLDRAKLLYDEGVAPNIATCGRWSLAVDAAGLEQPFLECDEMADYLVDLGVPEEQIFRESDSKDTISNLYYLKTQYLIPNNIKRIVFVVAGFRVPRLEYLCRQILGEDYICEFETIVCKVGATYNEKHTYKIQKQFLDEMKPGDHKWLEDKFYDAPMYKYWDKYNKDNMPPLSLIQEAS